MHNAKDILELNNAAVLQMRQDNHDRTITFLQDALVVLESMFESKKSTRSSELRSSTYQSAKKRPRRSRTMMTSKDDHDEEQLSSSNNNNNEDDKQHSEIGIICSVRVETSSANNDGDGENDGSVAFITPTQEQDSVLTFYDRAFTFLNHENMDFDSPENKSSMTAMVLYNMALAHHRQGIKLGRSKDLAVAMQFYRMAHSVLDQVKNVVGIEVHLLLLMALLNNMGHIHASTYNIEQTQRCIAWLKRALCSRHAAVLEADDFTFFLAFVKIVPSDAFKFAPAA